jgi:hypothetical protein
MVRREPRREWVQYTRHKRRCLHRRCSGGVYTLIIREPREKFPMGVGLCNEVRPLKIPVF